MGLFDATYPFQDTDNDLSKVLTEVLNSSLGTNNNQLPGLNTPVVDYAQNPGGITQPVDIDFSQPIQTTAQPPVQVQQAQSFPGTTMPKPAKKIRVGEMDYSENNPYMSSVKSSFFGIPVKMSRKWHEKAQEWEDKNMQRQIQQYNLERQLQNDQVNQGKYVVVTPELRKQLDPIVASALRDGQYIDATDLNSFIKTSNTNMQNQRAAAAWKGLEIDAEQALSDLPDGSEKNMLIYNLELAKASQDAKKLKEIGDQARQIKDSLSKRGVDNATIINKNAGTKLTEEKTKGEVYNNEVLDPLTAANKQKDLEVKNQRIRVMNSQIAKNQAQLQKIVSSGGSKAKNSQLVKKLTDQYKLYSSKMNSMIKEGAADVNEYLSFPDWVRSQQWSDGKQSINGDQMLALFNREIVSGVDTSELPEIKTPKGPQYKSSSLYTKNDWDYIDKQVKKRGSIRKTVFDLLKAKSTTEGQAQALANRFGMSLNELMAWYDKNKPKK